MEVLKKSSKALVKAIKVLKGGGVVVCPTDTVYGFLANAENKKAVAKIYKIKRRPKDKPLPVFVSTIIMAQKLAEIDDRQMKYFQKYWPGKYTFVVKRKKDFKLYGVDNNTIALRIPKYFFLNKLLEKYGKPLVQTSVNISTHSPITKIEDIKTQFFKDRLLGLIINGGDLKESKSSRIINLINEKITVLRK